MLVFIMVFILVLLMNMIFFVMSTKNNINLSNNSSFECGFDSKFETRLFFSYRFFLISILFLIFDVEITLMLSIPFLFFSEGVVFVFVFFIMILYIGLMYEYLYGSLEWV